MNSIPGWVGDGHDDVFEEGFGTYVYLLILLVLVTVSVFDLLYQVYMGAWLW